jgi:uncharacterized membrane protein YgcG
MHPHKHKYARTHPRTHIYTHTHTCCRAFYDLSGINIYHIFADVCPPARVSGSGQALTRALQKPNVPSQSSTSTGAASSSSSSSSSSGGGDIGGRRDSLAFGGRAKAQEGVRGVEDDDGDNGACKL